MSRFIRGIASAVLSAVSLSAQVDWSMAVSPTTSHLWGIAWSGGTFVAVGENGAIMILTSPDGHVWTARTSGTTAWLTGVAGASNLFVAVGAGGTVLTSPDGRTWTARATGTTERLNAVAYGNERWLAVGEQGVVVTSPDGLAWRVRSAPYPALGPSWLRGLCFGYGQFVATGENGAIVATADGDDFFSRTIAAPNYLEGVVYGRRRFVAVGSDSLILTSSDAVNWRGSEVPATMRAVGFFNQHFVGAAASGAILTSPDGVGWILRATGNSSALLALAGSPAMLVAVGLNGTILRAPAEQAAPVIVTPPASAAGRPGDGAVFSVVATGTAPLAYQWFHDGRSIAGATTDLLAYAQREGRVAPGLYAVTVTNPLGSVTSAVAEFSELPSAPGPADIIDPNFAPSRPPSDRPMALLALPDGKVLVGGPGFLVRLNADGSEDSSFVRDPALSSPVTIHALLRRPDGKTLAGGGYTPLPGESGPPRMHLVRYHADGRPDATFAPADALPVKAILQLVPQSDGKILVVNGTTKLERLNADGSVDADFRRDEVEVAVNGTSRQRLVLRAAALAPDGRIHVAGSDDGQFVSIPSHGYLARFRSDGAIDPSFPVRQTGYGFPRLLAVLPNGRVLAASFFFQGLMSGGWIVQRVNADGSPDLTYATQRGWFGRYGGSMGAALEEDGSVVVVRASNAPYSWQVSRLRPDGTDSQTLALPAGDQRFTEITAVAPLAEGRVLVGGSTGFLRDIPTIARLVARNSAPVQVPCLVAEGDPPPITVGGGDVVTLPLRVAGPGPFSYSWDGNNADSYFSSPNPATFLTTIGPTGDLTIDRIRLSGTYQARVTNGGGSVAGPLLRVQVAPRAPAIVRPPVNRVARPQQYVEFSAEFLGSGPITYQWLFEGTVVAGPSTPRFGPTTYSLYGLPGKVGSYQLVVTNSLGSVTSAPVTLTIDSSPRLANVATRGLVAGGERDLIVGFAIDGTAPKRVLLRALGPALAQFGVGGFVADPSLALFDARGARIDGNDNATGEAAGVLFRFGLFALPAGTRDAALVRTLAPGTYTMQVSGVGGASGVALAEVYEDEIDAGHLINLSARVFVGTGENVAIPGVVVSGSAPKTILLRAIGPTLAQFGVGGTLADPRVTLVDGEGVVIGANDNWGTAANAAEIAATAARTGAFALPVGSRDAALLVTVAPGSYTALVTGVEDSTGLALVEVYEVN